MIRRFTAASSSYDRPQRANVPGRKFSITASADSTIRRNSSRPRGLPRSSVTSRLFRAVTFHQSETPSLIGDHSRIGSPTTGFSILTTSAP